LKAVAVVAAVASLTINFGVIDLVDGFTGYIDQERNQVLDAGWGAVFGVVLPLGLLALLRRPERRIAGVQQTAVVGLALAVAGAAGESWRYLALAAGVAGVSAVLLALHPERKTFGVPGRHPDRTMLVLAAVAAGPSLVYVWRMTSAQRRDLPPTDAVSNGLHHWTVMAALALLVLLLVLLAALRTRVLVASIGPMTSEALAEQGLRADLEPVHPKMGHMVKALAEDGLRALERKRAAARS